MAQAKTAKWLLAEFFIIVVSILAAFGVEEFREGQSRQRLEQTALSNIRAEVEGNLEAIESVISYHQEVAGQIGPFLSDPSNWRGFSGFQVVASVAPRGVLPPALQHTAWETAKTTGALSLFDYDLSQTIAQVYNGQEQGVVATIDRMVSHVFTTATFRSEDTEAVLMLLGAMASELYAQETQLRRELGALLDVLPG